MKFKDTYLNLSTLLQKNWKKTSYFLKKDIIEETIQESYLYLIWKVPQQ